MAKRAELTIFFFSLLAFIPPLTIAVMSRTNAPLTTAHYISDDTYTLGSLSCAGCGHCFPLDSVSHRCLNCHLCGLPHSPGTYSGRLLAQSTGKVNLSGSALLAAARLFTDEEIQEAVQKVASVCGDLDDCGAPSSKQRTTRAGTTAVDNRVIEEAFCEQCGVHRSCKSFARQTRSADEGQTIFFQCTVCSSEWQQNS